MEGKELLATDKKGLFQASSSSLGEEGNSRIFFFFNHAFDLTSADQETFNRLTMKRSHSWDQSKL